MITDLEKEQVFRKAMSINLDIPEDSFTFMDNQSNIVWFDTRKGEYPKPYSDIVSSIGNVYWFLESNFLPLSGNTKVPLNGIQLWTYLPKINEDEI